MADYPLRKNVGRGLAGLSRTSNRKIDPREVQAMFADLASGVGVPLADAGAKYLRGDIEGAKESAAIEGALSAIPAVGLAAKPVYRAAKRAVPGALEATRRMAEEAIERGTPMGQMLEAASPSYVVKPQGNVNLTPRTRAETLRGPDKQTVGDFLKQIRGNPGMTKEKYAVIAERFPDPTARVTKAEFESRVPASRYSITPLTMDDAGGLGPEALRELALDHIDRMGVAEDLWDPLSHEMRLNPYKEYDSGYNTMSYLEELGYGDIDIDELPDEIKQAVQKYFKGLSVDEIQPALKKLIDDRMEGIIRMRMNDVLEYGNTGFDTPPDYKDIQRLVYPKDPAYDAGFFMKGVTHPEVAGQQYEHFPSFDNSKSGLIGHIRGTRFGEKGGRFQYPDRPSDDIGVTAKPNSVLLEELQADAQKEKFGKEQAGPTHKAHSVLFQSMIDDALRNNIDTVYYPTARTIAALRLSDPARFAPIYDEEIMKYGLNPLRDIPGVNISEIGPHPEHGPAYYEINFSPEAKEYILEGPGQLLPGYAEGGSVTRPVRKNVGRGLAGLSRATNRDIDPREVQAMFADVASGLGVPFTDAGAKYLRGDIEGAKESAAIEGALSAIPLGAIAAKPVYRAAKRAVPQALETTRRMAEEAIERGTPMGQMLEAAGPKYVVKSDKPGSNWMYHTYEGDVIPGIQPMLDEYKINLNMPDVNLNMPDETSSALNRWIDQKLGKYIINEMGTPKDPLRLLLQERGMSHVPLNELSEYGTDFLRGRGIETETGRLGLPGTDVDSIALERAAAGFPEGGMAAQEFANKYIQPVLEGQTIPAEEMDDILKRYGAAVGWERVADEFISSRSAKQWLSSHPELIDEYPWMAKLDPETPIYSPNYTPGLNFEHLIDELLGAMSSESELPPELRITPKQLEKMTMPQAVERVSRISDWTAENAERVEREGLMENLKAAPRASDDSFKLSFVDEPGGKWVDIPEVVDEKGLKLCTSIGKAGGWCTQHKDKAKQYNTANNRLVALIDAEGRPHIQANLTTGTTLPRHEDTLQYIPEAEQIVLRDNPGIDLNDKDAMTTVGDVAAKLAKERMPPDIKELKPPENSMGGPRVLEYTKRDPEYRQKITDSALNFLNSGEWGRVNDLDYFGIIDTHPIHGNWEGALRQSNDLIGGSIPRSDIVRMMQIIRDDHPDAPRFVSNEQWRDMTDSVKGYAEGGSVTRPASPGFNFEHISILADAL